MRILFVCSSMGIGGAEKLTALIANELFKKGNECAIFIIRNKKRNILNILNKDIQIFNGSLEYKHNIKYLFRLKNSVRNFNPDVMICESKLSYVSIKLAMPFSKEYPIFLAIHGYYSYSGIGGIITKLAFHFIRNSKDRVIVSFEKQIRKLMKEYRISKKKFILIPNGIDTDYYDIQNFQKKKKPDKIIKILHIGNFRPEKDQWTLMKGLKLLNDSTQEWKLMFRGDIPLEKKLEFLKFCKNNKFESKICFVDIVTDSRMLYKDADIFVLTSISEALPMSAIEAISMGIPCILTDVGGCTDIVENEKNGFIIEPQNPILLAEKLLSLIDNNTLLRQMSKHARNKAITEFDLKSTVEKYYEAITK